MFTRGYETTRTCPHCPRPLRWLSLDEVNVNLLIHMGTAGSPQRYDGTIPSNLRGELPGLVNIHSMRHGIHGHGNSGFTHEKWCSHGDFPISYVASKNQRVDDGFSSQVWWPECIDHIHFCRAAHDIIYICLDWLLYTDVQSDINIKNMYTNTIYI